MYYIKSKARLRTSAGAVFFYLGNGVKNPFEPDVDVPSFKPKVFNSLESGNEFLRQYKKAFPDFDETAYEVVLLPDAKKHYYNPAR